LRSRVVAGCAALLILLGGCTRSQRALPFPCLPGGVEVDRTVEGRPIETLVLGSGPQTILLIASIHGNESAGTPLLQQLVKYVRRDKDLLTGWRLVLLPIANPDGYVHRVRYNSHGIDLNRNFAASNRQSLARYGTTELSEPESKLIVRMLDQYKPARIVSIHQPLTCIDYDGPAEEIAFSIARYCELPVKLVGSRPGSLGSFAGVDKGIPIITLELPKRATLLAPGELWRRYGRALLAAVSYPAVPPGGGLATEERWVLGVSILLMVIAISILAWLVSRRSRVAGTSV
jgi:protein MpaA